MVFAFSMECLGQCVEVVGPEVPLYWDANTEPNIDFYNVYRSTTQGSGYVVISMSPQGADPISDTDLTPLSTNYYVVTAVNTSGLESGFSNELCVTVAGPPEPPPGSPPFPTAPDQNIFVLPGA